MTADGNGNGRGQGPRIALVIGNGRYEHAPPLANPANDARDISATFKSLDFDVIDGFDLTIGEMDARFSDFAARIDSAETALFFYAGHGLQVDGENYLVPVDAELDNVGQLNRQTIKLRDQLHMMSDKAQISVLLLDCCRDNPFTRSLRRGRPGTDRSVAASRGLARLDVEGDGSLIAFATSPDEVASDGKGKNSPFTEALLQHLPTSGLSLTDVMTDVINTVARTTDDQQIPWYQSSLRRRVFLKPVVAAPPAEPAGVPPPAGPPQSAPSAQSTDGPSTLPALDPGRMVAPDPPPPSKRISLWTAFAVPFLVIGLIGLYLTSGSDALPPPPPPPPPAAAIERLILRIGDIDAAEEATRRSAVADLEKALASASLTKPSERLRLVTALVRMAAGHSIRGLSGEGRENLVHLLNKVEAPLWRETGWETVWADARKAYADLIAREPIGSPVIGPLLRLRAVLLVENNASRPVVYLLHASKAQAGSISPTQAETVRRALLALGWKVLGVADSAVALGENRVRYGGQADRAMASLLAFDLRARGFPVEKEPSDAKFPGGHLEVWLSTAPPDDLWHAAAPVAAWCFQRIGPPTDGGKYSIRCHKDAATCLNVRNGSPGKASSACRFIAYLDRTPIKLKPGGTADSYWLYGQEPFGDPFPQPPQ